MVGKRFENLNGRKLSKQKRRFCHGCVIGCVNRFNKSDPRSFYRIPKNPEMKRRLWIDAIRRQDTSGKHKEPADHDRVCHLHFVTGMFMLW